MQKKVLMYKEKDMEFVHLINYVLGKIKKKIELLVEKIRKCLRKCIVINFIANKKTHQ